MRRKLTTLDENKDVTFYIGFDDAVLGFEFSGDLEDRHAVQIACAINSVRNQYQSGQDQENSNDKLCQAKPSKQVASLNNGYVVSSDDFHEVENVQCDLKSLHELLIKLIDESSDDNEVGIYAVMRNEVGSSINRLTATIENTFQSRRDAAGDQCEAPSST